MVPAEEARMTFLSSRDIGRTVGAGPVVAETVAIGIPYRVPSLAGPVVRVLRHGPRGTVVATRRSGRRMAGHVDRMHVTVLWPNHNSPLVLRLPSKIGPAIGLAV